MKNFLSSIIKKAKNFVTDLTPAAKIKYIVITALTVTIATSLLVAVSLNTSEPETPTNPEDFETGETASIDFDNEIIFDIGDESSSVVTTDVTTEDPSVTTSEVSGTEKNTSAEESTNVQTENKTESTDEPEPQPTDPSQDYNPDPQPEDTTNTPVVNPEPTETTTQTQTTSKPTETTTKTPQTEPKPTETTTAPQTQPKPTETTTKAPQTEPKPTETTKPQETEPQPVGQFSLKEKKYDYNGANVTILQVENKSQQAYTITITGKFKDANGNIVKTDSKTYEGFPAGWSNYFVFQPGVKYSSVSWGMETCEFTGKTVTSYFEFGKSVSCVVKRRSVDADGNIVFVLTPEIIKTLKEVVGIGINYGPIKSHNSVPSYLAADTVLFDSNGNLIYIGTTSAGNIAANEPTDRYLTVQYYTTDILWSEKDKFVMPDNLKNVSGILAITSVTE